MVDWEELEGRGRGRRGRKEGDIPSYLAGLTLM